MVEVTFSSKKIIFTKEITLLIPFIVEVILLIPLFINGVIMFPLMKPHFHRRKFPKNKAFQSKGELYENVQIPSPCDSSGGRNGDSKGGISWVERFFYKGTFQGTFKGYNVRQSALKARGRGRLLTNGLLTSSNGRGIIKRRKAPDFFSFFWLIGMIIWKVLGWFRKNWFIKTETGGIWTFICRIGRKVTFTIETITITCEVNSAFCDRFYYK